MPETIADWQTRIDEIDAVMARIASAGADSVSGFGRSVNNIELAELRRQRAFCVNRRNALISPRSAFGSLTLT